MPIGYRALTRAVLPSLNLPDNLWFYSNTVHIINLCPESTAQRQDCSGYTCDADQCEGIRAMLLKFNQLGHKFCSFDGQNRICRKGMNKAPPKPPSGNRDDEEVAKRQGSKSMRLTISSPPLNSVQTNDDSSAAFVASGYVEEKNPKESNNDSISIIITDVPNVDLFTIDNHGNTTRVFSRQTLPQCQENFLKWIEEVHEKHGLLLPLVKTEIIMQDRYDAVKATIEQFKRPVPTTPRNPYSDNSDSEGSHQSMPLKKNTPSQELQMNSDLEQFIAALPHLEPIHYSFLLAGNVISKCCLCSRSPCLTPWRTMFNIAFEKEDVCGKT